MLDYTRWLFNLDFCTPRYIILRELCMSKLCVGWGIRAKRYEEKVRKYEESRFVRMYWKEKEERGWNDRYGKEKTKYYNRNGWGIEAVEIMLEKGYDLENEIITREKDIQRQWEMNRIEEAKYNQMSIIKSNRSIIKGIEEPRYLLKTNLHKVHLGWGVRLLVKLRCGNLEEGNKYWLNEKERKCIFCEKEQNKLRHYIYDCNYSKG